MELRNKTRGVENVYQKPNTSNPTIILFIPVLVAQNMRNYMVDFMQFWSAAGN